MEDTRQADPVAGLIADLVEGGQPVDEGRFTLDPAAALAKLRGHQLADPRDYLLLLVEAGWIAGAGRPEAGVHIAAGALTSVEFGGVSLAGAALPELFTAALVGVGSEAEAEASTPGGASEAVRARRVLQLLGLAANAALALEPRQLRLTATDGEGRATRVVIEPDGALRVEAPSEVELGPNMVRFESRGAGRWLHNKDAVAQLHERCRYTSLPVWIDGVQVSRGPAAELVASPTDATRRDVRVGDRTLGVVGHTADPQASSRLILVNRGLAIVEPLDVGPGLAAIVEVDLPVDLSRARLVESAELEAIRSAVRDSLGELAPVPRPPPRAPGRVKVHPAGALFIMLAFVVPVTVLYLGQCHSSGSSRTAPPKPNVDREARPQIDARTRANTRKMEATAFALGCVGTSKDDRRGGRDCVLAAERHAHDPIQRDHYLRIGCTKAQDPEACERMIAHAREHVGGGTDLTPVGLALVESCLAIAGPDCVDAAEHLRHGYYPSSNSAKHMAQDYFVLRYPFPEVSEAQLLERACTAGIEEACGRD